MRFILKRIVTIFIFLQALSGCALLPSSEFSSNDTHEYLHSRNGQNLVINQPLTDSNISDFYQLPNQTKPAKISIKPPVIPTEG